jgi:hypothetical protein
METNKVNRLLELVKRPQQAKRKPSNFALYWAWAFYNLVALLFDVIAAGTVYAMMGSIAYAGLTFAAGFLPLLMHEFLFTRAYASGVQRWLAIIGAGLSVVTILGVGILAGMVNLTGFMAVDSITLEIAMIVTLVLVSGAHGLIAAVYFYIDDGIKAKQAQAESMAYHERRLEHIRQAKEILALAEEGADQEDEIAKQYGGNGGRELLNEILAQLRGNAINQDESAIKQTKEQAPDQDDEDQPALADWQTWLQGYQAARQADPKQEIATLQSETVGVMPPLSRKGQAEQ